MLAYARVPWWGFCMGNIGEQIVSAYLKVINGCEFVECNLYTTDTQGEIDVVGVNTKDKKVYICEVAVHLITGLQYTRNGKVDNTDRLQKKFAKDKVYAEGRFKEDGYKIVYQFWSPIVKSSKDGAKGDQMKSLLQVQQQLRQNGVNLELVVNESFRSCLKQLREYAGSKTEELKNPILRLMQVEEKLEKFMHIQVRRLVRNS